ncbi:MAG TPA: energy transducer TonB [Candidatus Deferrimicrobiaceae bacterium]|nr:energy transducer TonB [Candidatus Deferrimicrobiaceae bacterium]
MLLTSVASVAQEHIASTRKILAQVAPQYPTLARSMNIQGKVKADVLVAPNGAVESVEIKGGHPLLVQSAQNALREWKWEPAPHATHESVEVKFGL